jgi:hypothetical protein
MIEDNGYIYFTTMGNKQRQISKEEWEREWLRWWEKNNPKEDSKESS